MEHLLTNETLATKSFSCGEKHPMDREDDTLVFFLPTHSSPVPPGLTSTSPKQLSLAKHITWSTVSTFTWTQWPNDWNTSISDIIHEIYFESPKNDASYPILVHESFNVNTAIPHAYESLTFHVHLCGSLWDGHFMCEWSLKFDVCNQKCNISILKQQPLAPKRLKMQLAQQFMLFSEFSP